MLNDVSALYISVRKLLMAGVSPDETNEDGLTALHQVIQEMADRTFK